MLAQLFLTGVELKQTAKIYNSHCRHFGYSILVKIRAQTLELFGYRKDAPPNNAPLEASMHVLHGVRPMW